MGGEPRWGKMGKIKDICQPNNDAVIINMINMAMKEVRPKWAPTTMLPKVIPLGEGYGLVIGHDGRRAKVVDNKQEQDTKQPCSNFLYNKHGEESGPAKTGSYNYVFAL